MSDFLVELSKNPQARSVIKSLGLPIPMPPVLARQKGPWPARPLDGRKIAVRSAETGAVAAAIARTLAEAGADPFVNEDALAAFAEPGEAFGRRAKRLDLAAEQGYDGVVFDATGFSAIADLDKLYEVLQPLVGRVERNGRVVVLGRPAGAQTTVGAAAAQRALDGFVRSLAKELGKRGATASLLVVEPGAEARIAGPLRFFLAEPSVYVSGQPLRVDQRARALAATPFVGSLEGKVALVTGAARGIGEATAKALAAEGAKVICHDRPADDGPTSKLAREIGGAVFLVDVADADAPEKLVEYLRREHGGVDLVVHNAGVTRDKTLGRMKRELWDMTLDINLGAVARMTSALADGVLRDDGRVVCLSSVAGIAGNMGQTNYAASKAGIIGLVELLARELGPRGITVNAIAPGFIETRLTAAIPVAIREVGRRLNNLSQGGEPRDVAQAITFLASPGAQGVTGQVLRVCGGALIGA